MIGKLFNVYVPMHYPAIFKTAKNDNFHMTKCDICYFCSKHRLRVHVRTTSFKRF